MQVTSVFAFPWSLASDAGRHLPGFRIPSDSGVEVRQRMSSSSNKTKSRTTIWMEDAKLVSLREYCEESGVSMGNAIGEAVEDFLLTSAAARLETIRATRGAKNVVVMLPAIQTPVSGEPN